MPSDDIYAFVANASFAVLTIVLAVHFFHSRDPVIGFAFGVCIGVMLAEVFGETVGDDLTEGKRSQDTDKGEILEYDPEEVDGTRESLEDLRESLNDADQGGDRR